MLSTVTAILVAITLLLLYGSLCFNYQEWRYQRMSAGSGCGLPATVQLRWYGGLDQVVRNFNADKRHRVPAELEKLWLEEMPGSFTSQVRILGYLFLQTIDPENIQAILAKQFDDFQLGPTRRGNFRPLLGSGIFTDDGVEWVHSRALLRPQFTRNQVADLVMQERHVQHLFKHLCASSFGWTAATNLQPLFFRLTLDLSTDFLFGESVYSQLTALPEQARVEEDEIVNESGLDLLEVGRAFDRATQSLGRRFRFGEYYWVYTTNQFRAACELIHQFADFFVKRTLEQDLEKESSDRYVFLKELAKVTRDPIEIRSQLLNIFLAGRDTTAGLLSWVFWLLAHHSHIYDKLRRIVVRDFGTYSQPRDVSFNGMKSCSYLQHVMSETLRLFPSVPLNSRYAAKDTTLPKGGGPDGQQPIFVPRGTQVDYSVQVVHRRKDIWGEDASEFKPERWIGRKCGWEFLPFNGGPRICLGQQFALTEVAYVLVRILQRFDKIENLSDMPLHDPTYQYSLTTAPWEVSVKLREATD